MASEEPEIGDQGKSSRVFPLAFVSIVRLDPNKRAYCSTHERALATITPRIATLSSSRLCKMNLI